MTHTRRRPTLATLPLTGRAAPLGQPVPRRGTQARRAGARRPQAASYTGPSANAAAHAAAPLYRTLYACRSTAGPAHCTLIARLRLHGPCYRGMVHGTCADRPERGVSVFPLLVVPPAVSRLWALDKPWSTYRGSASETRVRKPPADLTLRQAELRRATGVHRAHSPIPAAPA